MVNKKSCRLVPALSVLKFFVDVKIEVSLTGGLFILKLLKLAGLYED